MAMSGVPCAVWRLVLLSAVWTCAASGRFIDDLTAEEQGLDIHTRTKRYLCRYGEFQCMCGQCVDYSVLCNGVADCADMSDETAELCSFVECPPYTFRCAYGACVDGSFRCDGKWDCVGGSDENYFLCDAGEEKTRSPATRPENTPIELTRPENTPIELTRPGNIPTELTRPENTPIELTRPENTPIELTRPDNTPIELTQPDNTPTELTRPENTPIELTRPENTPIELTRPDNTPTELTRPENRSTVLTRDETQCFIPKKPMYGSVTVNGCESEDPSPLCRGVEGTPVQPMTVLKYNCEYRFTLAGSPDAECKQGSFTTEPPTCEPVCGTTLPYTRTYVSYGSPAYIYDYPWTVGIYRNSTKTYNMTQICAGSLVSDRLVVSAAHCFWDKTRHAQQPKELFKFAVGKYYRDWDHKEKFQFRDAKEIAVHERYQGRRLNHANDIAVIVLDTPVEYNTFVRPICIDWQNKYENIHLQPNFTGTVVGWGYTEKGEPSDMLMKAWIPFVDFRKCWDTVAEKLRSYLTNDKFCAGYTNGTGARSGDSGGGFIFLGDGQWYLRGIVSVGESDITNANVYTAFTTVTDFLNFIRKFFP